MAEIMFLSLENKEMKTDGGFKEDKRAEMLSYCGYNRLSIQVKSTLSFLLQQKQITD